MTAVNDRPALRAAADAERWPDVVTVPHAPLRAVVARWIFRRAVGKLPLRVVEPDGSTYGGGSPADPVMRLQRPSAFLHRLGSSGTIGFGEAYMAADWTADDLAGVLTGFATHMDSLVPAIFKPLRNVALLRMPSNHDNTVEGSRENIQYHYDLSNDLFKLFLDESMTYSCALFDGEPSASPETLLAAQHRKIDRLLDSAGVHAGSRVLEIGTGWGELAIRAARRGAQVTSLTLSTEQADLARDRIAGEGLSDSVTVVLQDYREVSGTFDAVVSVEMIEAVGAPHWGEYFSTIDRVLAPGGRLAIQAILQGDDVVEATKETYTWIRKYIFPGGQLPSVEAIHRTVRSGTALRISEVHTFGPHYAETLRRWRARFENNVAAVSRLGFDETFQRMWSLYLAYCEAGFAAGYIDVAQIAFTKAAR